MYFLSTVTYESCFKKYVSQSNIVFKIHLTFLEYSHTSFTREFFPSYIATFNSLRGCERLFLHRWKIMHTLTFLRYVY